MADEKDLNVGTAGLLWAGFKGAVGPNTVPEEIMDYMDENVKTEADVDFMRDKAEAVGSDLYTALFGAPWPGAVTNVLFGGKGSYRGQVLDRTQNIEPEKVEMYNKYYGVENAPDLLGVFLGKRTPESEGLRETNIRPQGGYPFRDEGKNVYDVTPFVNVLGIGGKDAEKIFHKINHMKPGDTVNFKEFEDLGLDVNVLHHKSIDLGTASNWSIGKDENGDAYVALADSWDFSSTPEERFGTYGRIMDKIGVKNINFYGRFPIEGDAYIKNAMRDVGMEEWSNYDK